MLGLKIMQFGIRSHVKICTTHVKNSLIKLKRFSSCPQNLQATTPRLFARSKMTIPKLVIDTDAGLDDALGIFMALESHKRGDLEVVAITTVQGNTKVDNVCVNVLRILQTADLLEEIPVYVGTSESLVHPWTDPGEPFHGHDGFGDADLPDPSPPTSLLKTQHSVWELLELSKKYENELVLVALGPLTNVAMAVRLDPKFTSDYNNSPRGNINLCGEFNFTCDPEAARVVLEETQRVIHLVPWETCLFEANITYHERKEMGSIDNPAARLMNRIENKILNKKDFDYWITCDQLAVAWMIDDVKNKRVPISNKKLEQTESDSSSILTTETKKCFATVELQGIHTRGQLVIDHENRLKRNPNLIIMNAVDTELYRRYLRMGFGGGF
ncbi:inosine-uridine preferring nucleoside hydrolase-like [Penaeus japonicus]|uniref:inosine-uridine preferring nucleoside hydrolase-like n=1 Tax=Penaeus japonicus TaxID=27405 RepID=UPI001C70DBF7|nr:inosine-uridine preferring nucleoside hydrolase-like [Penaeus japonicus]